MLIFTRVCFVAHTALLQHLLVYINPYYNWLKHNGVLSKELADLNIMVIHVQTMICAIRSCCEDAVRHLHSRTNTERTATII
jgi:hypothetical protein